MAELKVLHLIEALGSGGAERLLYTNLKHFDKMRLQNEVVTIFDRTNFWKQPILELDVPVSSLGCSGTKALPFALSRLVAALRRFEPDLIHTHLWSANVIGRLAGRICKIPVISSVHNPEYEADATADRSSILRKVRIARFIDKVTASIWCQQMIAVSEYVRESTHRHLNYPVSNIHKLYNPVDIPTSGFEAEDNDETRDAPLTILNVARISPQKGLIYLVQAMPMVLEAFPNARLISIGAKHDAAHLKTIEMEIRRLGLQEKIELLGESRDVAAFLSECTIFAFPSLFEGLGIALAEAMAAECACIASDIKPLDEFVKNGVNGITVKPRDSSQLASAIIFLLQDPAMRVNLGNRARQTALELFEPRSAANQLTDIYFSVVEEFNKRGRSR